jgi:hypothetical protein
MMHNDAISHAERQMVMFSATWPPGVHKLAQEFMDPNPIKVMLFLFVFAFIAPDCLGLTVLFFLTAGGYWIRRSCS